MITQSPEAHLSDQAKTPSDSRDRLFAFAVTCSLTLMLTALWLLTHRYQGVSNDARLYALQALARIYPALGTDLSLQNTSQDHYTVFPWFFSWNIRWLGLENAALVLTVLFNAWILIAAWSLARHFGSRDVAWLVVAALIIAPGAYGGCGVFYVLDPFLTARLPAEALIVTSLALYFQGLKKLALLISTAALFVHPIMALPGLLLLLCLWLPYRLIAIGAVAGLSVTLALALAAVSFPAVARVITVIDPPWLEVIRERSEFLFLQLWRMQDWRVNARPMICLILTAMTIQDGRIRKLCIVGMLVGAIGLVIAAIASVIGPIAFLMQGQAWRWIWVSDFLSILLLAPTAIVLWKDQKSGPLCAVLLLLGWTYPIIDGFACVSLALAFWLARSQLSDRAGRLLRWTAIAMIAVLLTWVISNSWTIVSSVPTESGRESRVLVDIRNILGLGVSSVLIVGFVWRWLRNTRSMKVPVLLSTVFFACSAFSLPASFKQIVPVGQYSTINDFAEWVKLIPPTSSVLVAPPKDTGTFVWLTLGRPNYLSVDQSAGVVFSRETALEVRRRSQVLLPLMDPSWKILTHNRSVHSVVSKDDSSSRPLTRQSLINVCGDQELGFVISPKDVGFDPVVHTHRDTYKDWYLYDCRRVRSTEPAA